MNAIRRIKRVSPKFYYCVIVQTDQQIIVRFSTIEDFDKKGYATDTFGNEEQYPELKEISEKCDLFIYNLDMGLFSYIGHNPDLVVYKLEADPLFEFSYDLLSYSCVEDQM